MEQEPKTGAQTRVSEMLDSLLGEGLGQITSGGMAKPVLPKIKLVLPGASAPVSIKKKTISSKPLPPVSEILPKLVEEVKVAPKASVIQATPVEQAPIGDEVKESVVFSKGLPLRQGKGLSRIKKRHDLVFGKDAPRVRRKKAEGFLAKEQREEKSIYAVKQGEKERLGKKEWVLPPQYLAWTFLIPALLSFTVFAWLPIAKSFYISFFHYSPLGESSFIGTDNYVKAWKDPLFWNTWVHSGSFCLLSLLIGFWIPVVLSLYFNELKRGQTFLKLAFFLPFLTPVVPAIILWRWIFDQGYGVLNSFLAFLGVQNPHVPWLNHPALAMLAIVVVFLWKNTGWNALIYLTTLQGIDETLYETAEMDGANLWKRIKTISLPALKGTMGVLLLMQILNSLQIFTEVYLMTGGGPSNSTEMVATYLYKKSFLYMDIGYASAMSVLLFVFLISFTAFRLRKIEEEI